MPARRRKLKILPKIDKHKTGFGALLCSCPEAGGVGVPASRQAGWWRKNNIHKIINHLLEFYQL